MTSPRFTSPRTGRPVRAVLFDTFGTVVDWREGVARGVGEFVAEHALEIDPRAFADAWRGHYRPSMERVRNGDRAFVNLDILHRENLDATLAESGLAPADFDPGELDALSLVWHRLPAWPDSVAGLALLKQRYVVGPLSNGNTALLLDMAKRAGLPWDVIIGSDINEAYKPHPDAYLKTAALLGLPPGEVMLAAAHNRDLRVAQGLGLATAFVARPAEHGPGQTTDLAADGEWDVASTSIVGLAEQMAAASAS